MIPTVHGSIRSCDLGITLMHEHAAASSITMLHYFGNAWLDEQKIFDNCVAQLTKAKEAGVRTIVDGTPLNLGRDVRLLQRIAQATGLHIIASTGMYHPADFAFMRMPPQVMADYLIAEFTDGIQGTDIRPGILKCAVELPEPSDMDAIYLQVTALTSLATGLPIYMHTNATTQSGLSAVKKLLEYGVQPQTIIVGHCADALTPDYPLALLDLGVTICTDRIFNRRLPELQAKAAVIAELVQRGFAPRICLAHDHIACENKWNEKYPPHLRPDSVHDDPEGFTAIARTLIPELLKRGVTEDDIRTMLVRTPRTIFDATLNSHLPT